MRTSLTVLVSLVAIPAAGAAGPWLGTAPAGIGFKTHVQAGATGVAGPGGSLTIDGTWGLPRVTLNGAVGGLSADGRTLVLAQRFQPTGERRASSSFLVLGTQPLHLIRTVVLRGDFGFDALSPDGRTLYLIEHASANLTQYRVRAYDVPHGQLLRRVIADKRQRDWLMSGYPVARATSANGRWVYTLYSSPDNYPFVHALDTTSRAAVCIGIPSGWTGSDAQSIFNAKLRIEGGRLMIGNRFALDTTTFRVTKL